MFRENIRKFWKEKGRDCEAKHLQDVSSTRKLLENHQTYIVWGGGGN